jgi:hypothetical protein
MIGAKFVITALVATLSTANLAQDFPSPLARRSCQEWLQIKPPTFNSGLESGWLYGLIDGVNLALATADENPERRALASHGDPNTYINNYCKSHPNKALWDAAVQYVSDAIDFNSKGRQL